MMMMVMKALQFTCRIHKYIIDLSYSKSRNRKLISNTTIRNDYSLFRALSAIASVMKSKLVAMRMPLYILVIFRLDADNSVDSVRPLVIVHDTIATLDWWGSPIAATAHRTSRSPRFDASAWATNPFEALCHNPNGDDIHGCHHRDAESRSNAVCV